MEMKKRGGFYSLLWPLEFGFYSKAMKNALKTKFEIYIVSSFEG